MRCALYLFLSVILFAGCSKPTGYSIECTVKGLNNAEVFLAYYYGESTFTQDTTQSDNNGTFTFEGSEPLPRGVYTIVYNQANLFNLVIGEDQHFSMTVIPPDYTSTMEVKGDVDNELYFDYLRYDDEQRKVAEPLLAVLNDSTASESDRLKAGEEFDAIRNKMLNYQSEMINKHPGTTTSILFKAGLPVKPEDPAAGKDWYKEHFFDNVDLGSEVLIRLPHPLYKEMIERYLDQVIEQHPDSVIKAIDAMAAKARRNQETYKYLVLQCMNKYQNPDVMGFDKVFVHLADKYFLSGEMDFWANTQLKENLRAMIEPMRNSLIGVTAPDLVMEDTNGKKKVLHEVKSKYTIVYFFDPDCSHCQMETPKLKSFYEANKDKFKVEVYAVCTDSSMVKMRDYARSAGTKWITVNRAHFEGENSLKLYETSSLPMIYILDEDKTIIAKKLASSSLEEFFTRYEAGADMTFERH